MYKRIVAGKVRNVFAALSRQDIDPLLATLAPDFDYRFVGISPLAGRRTTLDHMRQWWDRVTELFPQLQFDVRDVVVQGHPGRTVVATHVALTGTTADGRSYTNELMQVFEMRWGRAHRVTTLEDTQRLQVALDALSAAGYASAHAAPIGAAAGVA